MIASLTFTPGFAHEASDVVDPEASLSAHLGVDVEGGSFWGVSESSTVAALSGTGFVAGAGRLLFPLSFPHIQDVRWPVACAT